MWVERTDVVGGVPRRRGCSSGRSVSASSSTSRADGEKSEGLAQPDQHARVPKIPSCFGQVEKTPNRLARIVQCRCLIPSQRWGLDASEEADGDDDDDDNAGGTFSMQQNNREGRGDTRERPSHQRSASVRRSGETATRRCSWF